MGITFLELFFYFIFHLLTCSSVSIGHRQSLRVFGGRDIKPGEFPYVARLEYEVSSTDGGQRITNQYLLCTAAVLSPTATLTAAHCCIPEAFIPGLLNSAYNVTEYDEVIWVVRYKSDSSRQSEGFGEVLSCIKPSRHPIGQSKSTGDNNDVAVLKTQPISLGVYARVSAVDYLTLYGQRVTVLGHGTKNLNGTADYKNIVPLQVWDGILWQCDDEYRKSFYPAVCVKEMCGRPSAITPGDSGGPVVHSSGVIGVTSGSNCGWRMSSPRNLYCASVIAPVGQQIDWIADFTGE